jgi:hypothetical protein
MATAYGLMIAGFNNSNAAEDEFNDWYDMEHFPERLRIKGWINAQRWFAVNNRSIAISTYDIESLAVLEDPEYLAFSFERKSPWSKRMNAICERLCRLVGEQLVPGREAGPDDAEGLLMVAMNVKPEAEADFNAWYDKEHLPRLSQVPGCLSARRFKVGGGTQRYVALYHLREPEVADSAAWKDAVNTPWTMKIRPHTLDHWRLVLRRYRRQPAIPGTVAA